jgi:hypothetical protein
MKEKIIDIPGIIEMLAGFAGHTMAFIRSQPDNDLVKKNRATKVPMLADIGIEWDSIVKVSLMSIRLGYDYTTSVVNVLAREGKDASSYQPGTSWHIPMKLPNGKPSSTIHVHKDDASRVYLWYQPNKKRGAWCKSEYINMATHKIIPKKLLAGYLPTHYAPKNQGVDAGHEVLCQTLKMENLKRLSFQGVVYNLA